MYMHTPTQGPVANTLCDQHWILVGKAGVIEHLVPYIRLVHAQDLELVFVLWLSQASASTVGILGRADSVELLLHVRHLLAQSFLLCPKRKNVKFVCRQRLSAQMPFYSKNTTACFVERILVRAHTNSYQLRLELALFHRIMRRLVLHFHQ